MLDEADNSCTGGSASLSQRCLLKITAMHLNLSQLCRKHCWSLFFPTRCIFIVIIYYNTMFETKYHIIIVLLSLWLFTHHHQHIGNYQYYQHFITVRFSLTKMKTKMVKNEKITNSLTKTKTKTKKMMKTKTKLKRENRKWVKTKKKKKLKTKTKMRKQQNLSLSESASIQYGAYGCYGRTAFNP